MINNTDRRYSFGNPTPNGLRSRTSPAGCGAEAGASTSLSSDWTLLGSRKTLKLEIAINPPISSRKYCRSMFCETLSLKFPARSVIPTDKLQNNSVIDYMEDYTSAYMEKQ